MQSAPSSAGYFTGSTIVGGIAALWMIHRTPLPFWTLLFWAIFIAIQAILGVMMAIPMKRKMINVE